MIDLHRNSGWSLAFSLLRGLLLALAVLLVAGPLLAVVFASPWTPDGAIGQEWSSLFSARRVYLLWNSLALAGCVALACMLVGSAAGLVLWFHPGRWAALLRWGLLAILVLPPYLHALTWMGIFDFFRQGLETVGLPGISLRGWFGAFWVQFLAILPVNALLAQVGLAQVNQSWLEAARLSRPDFSVLRKVALPLAAPYIWLGLGLAFLLSLMDYSVPYLFGRNVYALEIFASFSAHHQPGRALITALPLMFLAATLLLLSLSRLRTAFVQVSASLRPVIVSPSWPGWLAGLFSFASTVVILILVAPLLSLTLLSGGWQNFFSSMATGGRELVFTFQIMILAAFACLPLANVLARQLQRPLRFSWIWWLVTLLPLAVPGSLYGVGHVLVWNQPVLNFIYSSGWSVVLAHLGRFCPLAALVLLAQSRREDLNALEAARIFQRSPLHGWLGIILPMKSPAWLAAGSFVAILSAGELAATIILLPPGYATLTLRIFNFLHYGSPEAVAGLSLLLVILGLLLSALALKLLSLWSPKSWRARS